MKGPWNLLSKGPPNQIKRSPQPLDSYLCTVFCLMSLGPISLIHVLSLSLSLSLSFSLSYPFILLETQVDLCLSSLLSLSHPVALVVLSRRPVLILSCPLLSCRLLP
jgi:hypothetical protein